MSQVGNFSLSQKEASIGLIVYSSKHEQSEFESLGARYSQGLQGKLPFPFLSSMTPSFMGLKALT